MDDVECIALDLTAVSQYSWDKSREEKGGKEDD